MLKTLLLIAVISCVNLSFADQWVQRSDFGGVGRHRTTAINIGNHIYMGLGHFNGTGIEVYFHDWWEYDPATNAWAQKADYIGNNGNGELGAHGIGLELVGYVGLGEFEKTKLYKYDPVLNAWIAVTSAPSGINFQDTGDFTIGHKTYFTRLWSSNFFEYDADLDLWTMKSPTPFSTVYSWNGFSINGKGYTKIYDQLWEYDPQTDSWLAKSAFPGLAQLSSVAFVQNNMGYLICGYGSTYSDLSNEVWEYDPIADNWTQLPDFPGSSRRYSSGVSVGERCFMGTGTNGTNFNDFWEFEKFADIQQLSGSVQLNVYPNPAVDCIFFTSKEISDFVIRIHDALGKEIDVLHSKLGKVSYAFNELEEGTYFYTAEIGGKPSQSGTFVIKK